jgi:WD40 repeat protein
VRAILHDELAALPERYREPLVLCYLEGLQYGEAARRLGWSEATLKGRLQRGRDLLRPRLARRGLGLAALGTLELAGQGLAEPPSTSLTASTLRAVFPMLEEPTGSAATLARGIAGPLAPSRYALAATLLGVTLALAGGVALIPQKQAAGWTAIPFQAAGEGSKARADLCGDPLPEGAAVRLGTLRLRHAGLSDDFAFQDGGTTVVTAGTDRRVRFWDIAAGKQVRSILLQGKPRLGRGVTLSPGGKTLATLDHGKVLFWEVESGKEIKSLPLPEKEKVAFVFFSPDGKTLAVGTWNPCIYLYEWQTGNERRLKLPARKVGEDSTYHGRFSPDGKWFTAGGGFGCALCVFEVETGRELHRLFCNATTSAISPDGKHLVVSTMRNDRGGRETVLRLFDMASGKEVAQFPQGTERSYYQLAFSPDGKSLACGFSDESRVIEAATGRELFRLPERPIALAFTPDGKTLVGSTGKRLRFWDAASGKESHDRPGEFGHDPALAVSPDGRLLAASEWIHQAVSLWDLTSGKLLRRLPVKGEGRYVRDVAFSADGKTVMACQGYGTMIQYWEAHSGKETRIVRLHDPARPGDGQPYYYQVHPLPDGKHICTLERLFVDREATRLALWDATTATIIRQHVLPAGVRQGVWSADGETVILWLKEGLTVMDVRSGAVRFRVAGAQNGAPLGGSPDGRLLAARKNDTTLGVWEAVTGKEITSVTAGRANHFALVPDNRSLVTSDEALLRVWDLATGKERHRWSLPEVVSDSWGQTFVTALTLTPDGRRAITALADGTALVWDLTPALRPAEPLAREAGPKEVAGWWADLAGDDAGRAYAAVWRLAETPTEAVPLLRRHLKPVKDADYQEARRQIADLASETYKVREMAFARLKELGHAAAPALRQAMQKEPTLEARRRLESLLAGLPAQPPSPALVRTLRAIQVLERVATPDARRLLAELAAGMAQAEPTREARAALQRLSRR